MLLRKFLFLFLCSFIISGELEVEGDLKVSGNIIFNDESTLSTAPTSGFLPAGVIIPYAGTEAPEGWLLCNGEDISRTQYANLFIVVSEIYGSGNGSTTFNLPDLRGRMILGADNMGGSSADVVINQEADIIGGIAGSELHQLTVEELASHSHQIKNSPSGSSSNESSEGFYSWTTTNNSQQYRNSENTGGDQPHNNMPPYITLNYIIKY